MYTRQKWNEKIFSPNFQSSIRLEQLAFVIELELSQIYLEVDLVRLDKTSNT